MKLIFGGDRLDSATIWYISGMVYLAVGCFCTAIIIGDDPPDSYSSFEIFGYVVGWPLCLIAYGAYLMGLRLSEFLPRKEETGRKSENVLKYDYHAEF